MQALVKAPRMLENGAPVQFTVSGNVPHFVMELFRNVFPTVKEEDDDKINIRDWDWFQKKAAAITPGNSLRILRTMRGMKQKELADAMGIKPQQVSDMEKGKSPISKKMAVKLGKTLNMNYKHFL